MTAEKYLAIIKRTFAVVRFEYWKAIEEKKDALNVRRLESIESDKIYLRVFQRFSQIRQEVYAIEMDDPKVSLAHVNRFMQMYYIAEMIKKEPSSEK